MTGERVRRRVQVWGTGGVGSIAVRAVLRRADLELTGVWVHSEAKDGLDAGVLGGVAPVGLAATRDADALVADRPDCVVYAASGPELDAVAVPHYEQLLRAGVNVVTVSSPGLVYPPAFSSSVRERLTSAARVGGATLYASGIEPGFAADQLPLTLLSMCSTVRTARTQEIFQYDSYPVEFAMREVFGFGQPPDHRPIMALPGVQEGTWGPPVRLVAAALGVELDEIRETWQTALTDRPLDVACGRIDAGSVGAVRFETIGVVDGRDAIVIEHVNRMAPDLAPGWPTADRDGTYRIEVDGDPSFTCLLTMGTPADYHEAGMVATTLRLVNAVPAVCDAAPGLVSSLDLPLTVPVDPFHPRPAGLAP